MKKLILTSSIALWGMAGFAQQGTLQLDPNMTIKATMNNMSGYYRVSIKGFICNAETADDILERDGKRDEIYLTSQSHKVNAQGVLIPNTAVQHKSRVMGDINARNPAERRVMAGTADGGLGGIKTGDQVPDIEPFRNNAPATGDLLPFILWEGSLNNGEKAIVTPNIYEWDGPEDFLTTFWHGSIAGKLLQIPTGIASIPFRALGAGENMAYNFDTPGVWPAVGVAQQFPNLFQKVDWNALPQAEKSQFYLAHTVKANQPLDRPIGISDGASNIYNPLFMHLDANAINRLLTFDAGYGRGILPIYCNDQDGLNGKYVLFVHFEQILNESDKNRINLQSTDAFDGIGNYSLRNVNAFDKEADVLGGGTANNTHIVLNDLKGLNSQRWRIRKVNQYYFNITNNFNNGCLDILNKNDGNGSNIVTSACDNSEIQQWSFIRYCDGSWLVRNFKTKRMMEVYNAAKHFAAPMGQWDATMAKNQRWFIEKK
jgi:hypothetical protein